MALLFKNKWNIFNALYKLWNTTYFSCVLKRDDKLLINLIIKLQNRKIIPKMSISFRFTFFSDTSLFDYFCYNFRIIVSVKKCFLSTLIPCFDMYVKIIDEIIFLLLWSLGIDQKDGSARILTLSAVSLKGLDHTVNFYLYLVSI